MSQASALLLLLGADNADLVAKLTSFLGQRMDMQGRTFRLRKEESANVDMRG